MVNSGGTQHIPNKTRALYTARKPHYQVKELIQSLQMWMKSWGAVNKTAPQVDEGVLWMGWQSQQRQSELFRDKRRANKLFCHRGRLTGITVWEQLSMNSPTCEVNNAVITTYTESLFVFLFHVAQSNNNTQNAICYICQHVEADVGLIGLHVDGGTCPYQPFGRTELSLSIFVRACSYFLWSEVMLDHSHVPSQRIRFQDDQFEYALLALNWLKGRELEGSHQVQIWYLKYQPSDTEEARGAQLAVIPYFKHGWKFGQFYDKPSPLDKCWCQGLLFKLCQPSCCKVVLLFLLQYIDVLL